MPGHFTLSKHHRASPSRRKIYSNHHPAKHEQVTPGSLDSHSCRNIVLPLLTQEKLLAQSISQSIRSHKGVVAMIPSSDRFDQSTLAALLEVDPLVADYRAFFS